MTRPRYSVLPPPADPFAAAERAAEALVAGNMTAPEDDRQFARCTCDHCGYVAFVRPGLVVEHGLPMCPAGVRMREEQRTGGGKKRR